MPDSTPRLGLINHGGFFSPYYLFEVLARQHGDELDPLGREANRKPLRRVYRKAEERLSAGSTTSDAWSAWHRELLEALGFTGEVIRRLESPVETARHGEVPISHGAFVLTTDDGPQTVDDETLRGEAAQSDTPLVFIDCHAFGVDLDRDTYPQSKIKNQKAEITDEVISRAIEFALDHAATRWAMVLAGSEMRLYRKGGSVARQYLQVNFPALFDADRADEWTAFWGLFRFAAFVPDADGKCLLDRVLEESQRHASRIADDLRENIVLAVEAIMQGVLDDPANHALVSSSTFSLSTLFEETLYFLYRVLFVLYAESRDLLPVTDPIYRDTYSLEHLRELAEQQLPRDEGDRTYFSESIRTLFAMLHDGFPGPGMRSSFAIDPFNGQLFDPRRTALLDRCRIPDRALHTAIAELSLSRPRRRSDRRERFSYADLGVDQLGSIYEGLLVYEPAIVTEDTVLARVKGEERWLPRAQAEANRLEIVEGTLRRSGQFVLRLWGGRRKGSGSYYTPQEITSFLVKEALEPLVSPIIEAGTRPDDILELKVCDPAMGSGAFLIQACRFLAEAYGRARIAAGLDDDGRVSQEEFAKYKRLVAERCLYGVDLNRMAVELAKVSLWLETLARGKPLDFLDAHLRCGNSLIGAPLRDADGRFSVERLLSVPEAALKEVSKEASKEAKAAARERIKCNKEEIKRLQTQQSGQLGFGFDWGTQSFQQIEAALTETVIQRATFERVDVDLLPAEAVALIHEKEQAFERLQTDPQGAYVKVRLLCDLWCAVWFWPSGDSGTEGRRERETGGEAGSLHPSISPSAERPTTQVYLELIGALLGTDEGSLSVEQREAYWRTVNAVWREMRFFHWELEFPEVWREKNGKIKKHGGFDAIVGNPPWETIKPNSQEFWSNYDPLFRDLPKQAALRRAEELREDEAIDAAWLTYLRGIEATGHYLKESEVYSHQGRGDINTYKLFLERGLGLLRNGGGLSQVLPSGINTDLGSSELRRLLFETTQIRYMLAFVNERFMFPAVDHRFRIVMLNAQRGSKSESLNVLFRLNIQNAVAPEDLPVLLANIDDEVLCVRINDVRRFSPNSLSLMEFSSQREGDIVAKIYDSHPLLGEDLPDTWRVRFTAEFHMTGDSRQFRDRSWLTKRGCIERPEGIWLDESGDRFLPLYEGKMFHQFETQVLAPKYWLSEDCKQQTISPVNDQPNSDSFRLAWRDIAASTNERTFISAILPRDVFGNHKSPLVFAGCLDAQEMLMLESIWNSFVIDSIARKRVLANLTYNVLFQLPIPRIQRGNKTFDGLVPRALRLTCTTSEFADLWREVTGKKWREKDAATDPHERAQLRAEIDGLVADLYGLSESDFAYILSTFPLLDRDHPALPGEPKSYITRDMALLELFKLRGQTPPEDIIAFHREAGVEIGSITGEVRSLAERVRIAVESGAIAYVPSGRGARGEEVEAGDEEENEVGEE